MKAARGAATLAAAALLLGAGASAEEPYRLGPDDVVRLEAPGAPGYDRTYRLGEGGRIGIATASPVLLGGLTLDEAAARLREALAGELASPLVGLELTEPRPFFISGDVAEPGAYPARPGLTLGRAVAIAGGVRRGGGGEVGLQTEVLRIRATEERGRALRERAALVVRRARIEAELAGAEDFPVPDLVGAAAPDVVAAIVARERAILDAAEAAFAERQALLAELVATRDAEIAALEGRMQASMRQRDAIETELEEVRGLVARALAPTARLNVLAREADRQESDILQIEVMLNQARQARFQHILERANAPRERLIALTEGALDAEARIDALTRAIAAATDVAEESGGVLPESATPRSLRFHVTRADGERLIATSDDALAVRPGDLVEVRRQPTAWAVE